MRRRQGVSVWGDGGELRYRVMMRMRMMMMHGKASENVSVNSLS